MSVGYRVARTLELRGGARELMQSQNLEVVLSGAAGTGKSVSSLAKLHTICESIPRIRALIVRKTRASLTESALVTFEEKVLPENHPATHDGGQRSHRQRYLYPNGSQISIGGMDKPSKIMSTEYDLIYVQEAIELEEADWEALVTRLGRNNILPYQQILADTNPDGPNHWIKRRSRDGKLLLLESRHEDNPALYTPGQGWTPTGKYYLETVLEVLTGLRRARLRDGKWVQAEGAVYTEFDSRVHVRNWFLPPLTWPRLWVIDFGFTNPFVCQVWARDDDGRLYLYREIYHTKKLVADHAARMLEIHRMECATHAEEHRMEIDAVERVLRPKQLIADHDAEDRATLERALGWGISPALAIKQKKRGIEAAQMRMRVQPDGKPRMFFLRDALDRVDPLLREGKQPTCTLDEIEGYVWDKHREEPLKENDHGMDCLRYVAALDISGLWEAPTVATVERANATLQAPEKKSRLFGR